MAIPKEIWVKCKSDFEAGYFKQDNVLSKLSEKYKIDRSTIGKKAKKEGWVYGKNSHICEKQTQITKEISQLEREKSQLTAEERESLDEKSRLELLKLGFADKEIKISSLIFETTLKALEINLNAMQEGEIDFVDTPAIVKTAKEAKEIITPTKESIVINNTNATQVNTKTLEDFYEDIN